MQHDVALSVWKHFLREYASDDSADISEFLPYLKIKSYKKGELIARHGDDVSHFFLMSEGLVRCFYIHKDTEVNLRFLCDVSAVVPYSAYITQSPSKEYIECLDDCYGLQIAVADIEKLKRTTNDVSYWLKICADQHYLAVENRLKMIQHKSASDRYEHFKQLMPKKISQQIPSYHIASYLGIAPQSFSRIKQKL